MQHIKTLLFTTAFVCSTLTIAAPGDRDDKSSLRLRQIRSLVEGSAVSHQPDVENAIEALSAGQLPATVQSGLGDSLATIVQGATIPDNSCLKACWSKTTRIAKSTKDKAKVVLNQMDEWSQVVLTAGGAALGQANVLAQDFLGISSLVLQVVGNQELAAKVQELATTSSKYSGKAQAILAQAAMAKDAIKSIGTKLAAIKDEQIKAELTTLFQSLLASSAQGTTKTRIYYQEGKLYYGYTDPATNITTALIQFGNGAAGGISNTTLLDGYTADENAQVQGMLKDLDTNTTLNHFEKALFKTAIANVPLLGDQVQVDVAKRTVVVSLLGTQIATFTIPGSRMASTSV